MLLAERLVAEALAGPERPIPLLESLSQFQDFPPAAAAEPETTQSGPPKRRRDPADERWIQTRLARLVGGRPGISRRLDASVVDDWIESGRVVLLLDGLDEVEESRHAALSDRLNRTLLRHHPNVPIVIASRVVEYLGWLALALSQRVQTRFDARRLWSLLQTEAVVGDRDWHDPIRVGYVASLCVCLALAPDVLPAALMEGPAELLTASATAGMLAGVMLSELWGEKRIRLGCCLRF